MGVIIAVGQFVYMYCVYKYATIISISNLSINTNMNNHYFLNTTQN